MAGIRRAGTSQDFLLEEDLPAAASPAAEDLSAAAALREAGDSERVKQ